MARRPGGAAALQARIEAAPGLDAVAAHKLAGLLEGECHLGVVPNNRDGWRCHFSIALRDDDRDILVEACNSLGIGQLHARPAYRGSRPQVVWIASSKLECATLVDVLEAHPFRGKRLSQYEI